MKIEEIEVKNIMTKTNLPVSDFAVKPVVCNYFYHEEVRKSAKK